MNFDRAGIYYITQKMGQVTNLFLNKFRHRQRNKAIDIRQQSQLFCYFSYSRVRRNWRCPSSL